MCLLRSIPKFVAWVFGLITCQLRWEKPEEQVCRWRARAHVGQVQFICPHRDTCMHSLELRGRFIFFIHSKCVIYHLVWKLRKNRGYFNIFKYSRDQQHEHHQELIRYANYQAPPQNHWIRILGGALSFHLPWCALRFENYWSQIPWDKSRERIEW